MNTTRIEHDLLGDREVPADRYFGVQTLRAVENFDITGIKIAHYPRLIKSLAYIKKAAALTNRELGLLDPTLAEAIGRSWIHTGDPRKWMTDVDEIEKITAADVKRVIKQYLSTEHATVVVIPPKGR